MNNEKDINAKTTSLEEKDSKGIEKKEVICTGCKKSFPSKNALFRHLRDASKSCLSEDEYRDFLKYVVNRDENLEKIAVLYGYIPSDYQLRRGLLHEAFTSSPDDITMKRKDEKNNNDPLKNYRTDGVNGGEHAAQLLELAIKNVSMGGQMDEEEEKKCNAKKSSRSYGHVSRGVPIVAQEHEGTGAITEVLCTRAPPLLFNSTSDTTSKENGTDIKEDQGDANRRPNDDTAGQTAAIDQWVDQVNTELKRRISAMYDGDSVETYCPGKIQVFGRHTVKKKFNPELDVTNKRMDYLLPAEFLADSSETQVLLDSLGSFGPTITVQKEECTDNSSPSDTTASSIILEKHPHNLKSVNTIASQNLMLKFKKLMQRFCTHIMEVNADDRDAVLAKNMNEKKRKRLKRGINQLRSMQKRTETNKETDADSTITTEEKENGNSTKKKGKKKSKKDSKARVLKRKRYHNFTPKMMAHEYLANRRLDRFFHREVVRWRDVHSNTSLNENDTTDGVRLQMIDNRPFIVLSMTGDLFLFGQARGLIGLFTAIVKGLISEDFIECIFDEEYPSLVPAPFAPLTGSYLGESNYMTWEGKMKFILTPRPTVRYTNGWNTDKIMNKVHAFQKVLQAKIMSAWCSNGVTYSKSIWINDYLLPWSKRANEQLEEYQKWKAAKNIAVDSSQDLTLAEALLPQLESINPTVPEAYERVLYWLREANKSGKWPSTTPKRKLVMVSTTDDSNNDSSTLAEAHIKAQSNNDERTSPYEYREGEGGASGSFSVGVMPGRCGQPKGNILFPELMKAAFELEIALCPDREPSSTIAINRNAQFRPHVDSGAGAGQSTSLIVGLGTYVGGELLVEGEKNDIRYKFVEFNGWKQRHWTLPFKGERFSLVWFTPKGCEGARGIDLCLDK